MGKAQIVQDLRYPAFAIFNPEALFDHRLQVNPAPPNNAIRLHVRAGLYNGGKLTQLVFGESAGGTTGPAVNQPIRAICIEPKHPVAKCLTIHAANARCLCPAHAVINGGKRQ